MNWVSKYVVYVCMYVCIFAAVEEEQDEARHRRDIEGGYFKLATPHLKLSPNFHHSFCVVILMLKL